MGHNEVAHEQAWRVSIIVRGYGSIQSSHRCLECYRIEEGSLTLHQDRGAPMTAHCYLDLLSELA